MKAPQMSAKTTLFHGHGVWRPKPRHERLPGQVHGGVTCRCVLNEEHEAQRFDASLKQSEEAQIRARKTLAVLNIGQNAIISVGVTVLMWRAAAGVVAGELSVGDLVLVNAYLLQLAIPLNLLGMMYREVKQAFTNLERLFGLLGESQDIRDAADAVPLRTTRPEVRFEAVRFGYDPRREILHGVDFVVPPGGTVAVVEPAAPVVETVSLGADAFFDFDKYNLKPAGRARLDKLVVDLRRVKSVSSIEIVGRTDSKGTEAYNYQLGHRRADTVANYLAAQGVPSSIISTSSRGELDPVAPNTLPNGKDNPAGRALNRRVVITVTAMEKVISQ